MACATILDNRAVIALSGGEAGDFLQGLVTSDVAHIAPGRATYSALLTPQGKILFDFIIAGPKPLLLDCAGSAAEDLNKRLNFYRLRADVQVTRRAELAVAAVWDLPAALGANDISTFQDPRLAQLGMRLIGERAIVEKAIAGIPAGDYDRFRLQLGVPDSGDMPPDQIFALDAGLAELHGVSFTKGCYVGQEVTARMKHRATARRRFYVVEADQVPPPGTAIEAQGRDLGRISSARGSLGLALVRLDRLSEAQLANAPLVAAGKPVSLRAPDWLNV